MTKLPMELTETEKAAINMLRNAYNHIANDPDSILMEPFVDAATATQAELDREAYREVLSNSAVDAMGIIRKTVYTFGCFASQTAAVGFCMDRTKVL